MTNTLKNKLNPLSYNVPIVNQDGTPTSEFQRKWAQQQAANASIPDLTNVASVSAMLDLVGAVQGDVLYRAASGWTVLAPGADGRYLTISSSMPAWTAFPTISSLLDGLGATPGDVLYRGASAWQALAPGSANQVLTYNATTHAPEWDAPSGALIGAGAPSALVAAGTLYSQSDAPAVWTSQPVPGPIAVQHAEDKWGGSHTPSVTFANAPANGNLLVAFLAHYQVDGAMAAASGWTRLYDDATGAGGTNNRVSAYYKYAGTGESTTQTPVTGGSSSGALQIWEINGVTGTWATDFREEWHALAQTASPSLTSAAHNTAANNQFVLSFSCGEIFWNSGNQGAAPTNGANGQTNAGAQFNDTGTVSHQASIGSYKEIATSGTNYQLTTTYNVNQEKASYQFVSLNVAQGFNVANWDKVTVPTGGTTGQVLTKNSNTDFDEGWATPAAPGLSAAQAAALVSLRL